MWTVTWKLHPLAVMPHLLGGMGITTCLSMDYFHKYHTNKAKIIPNQITKLLWLLLLGLVIQIMLGGWTSANYAALVCPDFPTCQGKWLINPEHFFAGFTLPFGFHNYEGGVISASGRMAIHITHRLGAVLCSAILGLLIIQTFQWRAVLPRCFINMTRILAILFALQILLGILNIRWSLPLSTAVAHNLVALFLLLQTVIMCTRYRAKRQTSPTLSEPRPVPSC